MNVDANGMPEIRRLFPQKARQIDEALDLATTYAWNSFRNLQLLKSSDSTVTPVHQLIMDFIDVPQVQSAHVEQLEKVVGDIFAALLDPTLRKPKTSRFVVGRLLSGAANIHSLSPFQRMQSGEFTWQKSSSIPISTSTANIFPTLPSLSIRMPERQPLSMSFRTLSAKPKTLLTSTPADRSPDLIETTSATASDLKNALTDTSGHRTLDQDAPVLNCS